jgi:hypothetical protein
MANDQDLLLSLKKANSERKNKRTEMLKVSYYSKLFQFLESRFSDGETFTVQNYFNTYKMVTKDKDGNDKTVYGLIADNNRTYLGLNDLAFPKKLWKREIKKVDGEETTTYTQIEKKILQGDLAILFDAFKSRYKDSLLAFDLLYLAIAKHNKSKFIAESFIYPTECFQRFKGEYTTGNFYLFNLVAGGKDTDSLKEIIEDICKAYEANSEADEADEADEAKADDAEEKAEAEA